MAMLPIQIAFSVDRPGFDRLLYSCFSEPIRTQGFVLNQLAIEKFG